MAHAAPSPSAADNLRSSLAISFESQLTEQLGKSGTLPENNNLPQIVGTLLTENRAAAKIGTLSDAPEKAPSPSPTLLDLSRTGKDEMSNRSTPSTPHNPNRPAHGLSLEMPPKIFASPGTGAVVNRTPLSPKLDPSHIYGSPASVLPRRSRGLDFSRACTNLHHSTLAESSPDSSPVVGGRGVAIPQRRNTANSSGLGSPSTIYNNLWSSCGPADRTMMSSSVSSVNMFDSDSTSSSDDDDYESMHIIDREDAIVTTPQIARAANGLATPFSPSIIQSPGGDWMGGFSTAKASLMSFQRARLRRSGRSRHSSTSTSGNSSKPSPAPISPPTVKSTEASASGYFSKDMTMSEVKSRRESLSLGTSDLHLSDMSDDGENRQTGISSPSSGSLAGASNLEGGRRGVIRRPVTRRANLLPKPKNFARIRAALFEECTPIDSEVKREAEVIRQVRESDPELAPLSPSRMPPGFSSLPARMSGGETQINAGEPAAPLSARPLLSSFSRQATSNSGGIEFWNSFDGRYRTPPPPVRQGSSVSAGGDDTGMDTPSSGSAFVYPHNEPARSRSSTPNAIPPAPCVEASHKGKKRRRDDDLDLSSFKRRAVSPGKSAQGSPVLPHSTIVKENSHSAQLPKATVGSAPGQNNHGPEHGASAGHLGAVKRVGLQGMNETNDGLMNMTID